MKHFFLLLSLLTLLSGTILPLGAQAQQLRKELEARLEQANGQQRVDILNQLAEIYIQEAAQDSGRQQAEEAIQLAESIEYEAGKTKAYYNLGKFYAFQARFPEALENYQKSIAIGTKLQDSRLLIPTYNDLSYIYSELGNYSKALEYALNSARLSDQLNEVVGDQSQTYDNISFIYQELGNFDDAKTYARAALEADSIYGDRADYALGINNLGEIYKSEGDYARALELYQKALRIFNETDSKPGLVRYIYSSIGEVMVLQENPDEAIEYLKKALKLDREYSDKEGIIYESGLLSQAYLQKKDYGQALRYAQEMESLSEQMNFNELLRQSYQYLASAYAGQRNYQKAFEYENQYARLSDQLYQDNATRHIAEMKAEYELDKKEEEILLLNERQKQQDVLLEQHTIQTRFLVFSSLLGVALIFVLFFRFREKQYANKVLESQKNKIEEQNRNLEELNKTTNKQKKEIERQKSNIEKQNEALAAKNEEVQRKQSELQRTYQDLNHSHLELTQAHEELRQTAEALDESNAKLEHSYGQITSSINYAKRIQEAMLPDPKAIRQTFKDFFLFSRPRDIVSGDFYWYAELDESAIFIVADCTGHGVPGAIMSMAGNAYLNQIVLSQQVTSPDKILEALHQNISRALRQQETDNKDGMDVTVCVLNKKEKQIYFSGAKNPLVYLREGKLHYLKGDRTMIGGVTKLEKVREPFTVHQIPVDAELRLYMYSDGYQDQFGGQDGHKFMSKRFRQLLQNTATEQMEAQGKRLQEVFDDWRGENKQLDDVLVVGLKISPEDFS